jgi:hypothetical protein
MSRLTSSRLLLISLFCVVWPELASATPTYTVSSSTITGQFPNPLGFGSEEFSLTGPQVSITGGAADPSLSGLTGVPAGVTISVSLGGNCFADGCGFSGVVGPGTYGQPGQDVELPSFPMATSIPFAIPAGAINPTITVGATVAGGAVDSCMQSCGEAGPFDLNILPETGILTVTFDNEPGNLNLYDEVSASFTSVPEPGALPVAGFLLLLGWAVKRAAISIGGKEEAK